jgi:hypothetical protein
MRGISMQSQCFIFSDIEKVSIPKRPGVYIVYWIKNGKRRIIYRILRDDVLGILYIGSSSNLHRRLKEDLKGDLNAVYCKVMKRRPCTNTRRYKHTLTLSLIYTNLINEIHENELMICYKTFNSRDKAEMQEAMAIHEYTKRYGEPPPLNLNLRRKYIAIWGIGEYGKSRVSEEIDLELAKLLGVQETS